MSKSTPTSWIIFLFVTGFVFIGYGVHDGSKNSRVGIPNRAEVVTAVEDRSESADLSFPTP
jgi:hypothetical protein